MFFPHPAAQRAPGSQREKELRFGEFYCDELSSKLVRQTSILRCVVPSPSGSRVPSGRQGEGKTYRFPIHFNSPRSLSGTSLKVAFCERCSARM